MVIKIISSFIPAIQVFSYAAILRILFLIIILFISSTSILPSTFLIPLNIISTSTFFVFQLLFHH